jgi:DNA invertase Pin-like site-specific DNA recombinase
MLRPSHRRIVRRSSARSSHFASLRPCGLAGLTAPAAPPAVWQLRDGRQVAIARRSAREAKSATGREMRRYDPLSRASTSNGFDAQHGNARRTITATNVCAPWSASSLARPRVNGSSVRCGGPRATTRGDTALKVAIYARYSSDNQRDASIADQAPGVPRVRGSPGWTVVQEFTDHAISGATLLRSGFQALMRDALNGRFDVVLAEALDRFSRDQEDTAGLFKRLTFAGVNIVTLAEGDITHLHVGLKGTMNALFLKDLADKTRRGLRGRVELGKSGGGLCYGYRVSTRDARWHVRLANARSFLPEAEVIRRIFNVYSTGMSPKALARQLNAERCPGPGGAPGIRARFTAILPAARES